MPFIDSNHQRAALLLLLLGLGLVIALSPYATGLIGIPVLYVVFAPPHGWLTRHVHARLAASLVVVLALFLIAVPGVSFAGLIVNQAQQIAGGVIQSPVLGRLSELHVGTIDVGSQLADLGAKIVSFIGSSAFGLIGTATRLALNLTISLFGLFFLLLSPGETWSAVQPYIPFSAKNTEKLRARFRDVTTSTIIGTGLTAALQRARVGPGRDRPRLGQELRRRHRARTVGRDPRGQRGLRDPPDGVPPLGPHPPAHHIGRRTGGSAVLRHPRIADWAAGAVVLLRADKDV